MNEFYSIAKEHTNPKDEYQLKNLGPQTAGMSFYSLQRDGSSYDSTVYHPTNSDDYDGKFSFILSRTNPPYEIENILSYHLNYYIDNGGEKGKFIKHMKYVIVPFFKQHKYSEVHLEIINDWINNNSMKDNKDSGTNISGSNNVVNIAGGNIHQSGVTINFTQTNHEELKKLGVDDNKIAELKELIEKNKQDKPSLLKKGILWIAGTAAMLTAKGLENNLPVITDYVTNLIHQI